MRKGWSNLVTGIQVDMEFMKNELGFSNGMMLPQFLFLEKSGQTELAKQVIAEIKAKYPHYKFS